MQDLTPVQQEVFTRLDAIAAKLGVASEHLWQVIVQQYMVTGASNLFFWGLIFLVTTITCVINVRSNKSYSSDNGEAPSTKFFLVIFSVVFIFASIIVFLDNGPNWISQVWNPEYWAWIEVKNILK